LTEHLEYFVLNSSSVDRVDVHQFQWDCHFCLLCRMDAVAELHQCIDTGMEKLVSIWDDIGIMGEQRSARNRVVLMHLGNLLDEMVREEDQLKTRLKENVEKYQTEVTRLCTELCLSLYEVCRHLLL